MKNLLFFLLLLPAIVQAQTTIYGTIQPSDMGAGVRIDQQIFYHGFYVATSWGNYKFTNGYVKRHNKLSLGGLYYLSEAVVSAGICYHKYGDYSFYDGNIPKNTLKPFSFEIGAGSRTDRFSYALTVDPIKPGDIVVSFGWLIIK